jgi:hypothetical protein
VAYRALSALALLAVSFVGVAAACIVWQSQMDHGRESIAAPFQQVAAGGDTSRPLSVVATSANVGLLQEGQEAAEAAPEEGTPSPAFALPKRQFTWEEIEEILGKLRQERAERVQARNDLESWYTYLASPRYSQSADVPDHAAKLGEWRRKIPDSPTPYIVLAKTYISYAWQARGSGTADKVTQEGGQLFDTRIAEAHRLLERALKLNPQDGEIYAALIEVAKAEGLPRAETEALLEAGMKLDPTYTGMYKEMAVYLLPRWHGEHGDIEEFAANVLRKIPGDDGLDHYGHIAYAVNGYDPRLMFWGRFDRQTLVKAAEVLVQRYPRARNLPCFAALCTMAANDREAARRIRPVVKYKDAPRIPTWAHMAAEYFDWCQDEPQHGGEVERIWVMGSTNLGFANATGDLWFGPQYEALSALVLDPRSRRIRSEMTGFPGRFHSLNFDRSKKWFIAAANGGDRYSGWVLWDARRPNRPIYYPTSGRCQAVAIDPQANRVAWAVGTTVKTMDVATKKVVSEFEVPEAPTALEFSPDGKSLGAFAGTFRVFDVQSGKKLFELPNNTTKPAPAVICETPLGYEPEGRIVAKVVVTGTEQRQFVRFSHDGTKWDVLIRDLAALSDEAPRIIMPSLDLKLFAFSERSTNGIAESIGIWDIEAGKLRKRLGGYASPIGWMVFSDDGKQLASLAQGGVAIKLWSTE